MKTKRIKPPMQPIVLDDGKPRFQANKVVVYLMERAIRGAEAITLEELLAAAKGEGWPPSDYDQFLQLTGWSVNGAPLTVESTKTKALDRAASLLISAPSAEAAPETSEAPNG